MNRKMKKNPITVCLLLLAQVITGIHLNAAEKPNVIIILVDDMGFSDIGAYGGEITPLFPPSSLRQGFYRQADPAPRLFQGPPAKSKFLAAKRE
jgi:hypothetical protein